MAVNSPGSYNNFKSPRSPRHLPQPPTPQQQLSGQRSPSQLLQNLGCKSPSTPRVFEFPPENYPETPNANYDYELFPRSAESVSDSRSSLLPESIATASTSNNSGDSFFPSSGFQEGSREAVSSSSGTKSPVFQFCSKKKTFVKTLSYPPKSPVTTAGSPLSRRSRSPNSAGPLQPAYIHRTLKPLSQHAQRSSCFNLGRLKNPLSPTAMVAATSSENFSNNDCRGARSALKLSTGDEDGDNRELSSIVTAEAAAARIIKDRPTSGGGGGGGGGSGSSPQSTKQFYKSKLQPLRLNLQSAIGITELSADDILARRERNQQCDSPKKLKSERMGSVSLNKSYGCLNETSITDEETTSASFGGTSTRTNSRNVARKSTSDLTGLNADEFDNENPTPSSPRRRGSMKGGLAYLASRRGSRDSQMSNVSNVSNVSNEDIGPLNFNAHPRGRQRRTSNFLELPVPDHIRPRVHSLPEKAYNPRAGDDLYRLRAFSITHKGVVNRGDSIISRRSRSNTSVNSSRNSNVSGERSPFEGSCCSGQGVAADSTESDVEEIPKYRVVLLGDSGVGKTALVSQFMTSEYMNTYDASLDDEFGEKTVSILLDGEESEMVFIDHPHVEMSVENSLSTYEPHACIVVYSIVSRGSFQVAEEMLNYLWREHFTQDRSVIVVGNKSDLARSRKITANEGKQLATSRECKFIETSSGIQHNVDELLVGVLKQIRLRETRDKKLRRQGSKGKMLSKLHGSKTALSLNLAKDILNKMCLNDSKSKSCENLHVL